MRELEEEASIHCNDFSTPLNPVTKVFIPSQAPHKWCLHVFAAVCSDDSKPVAGDDALEAKFFDTMHVSRLSVVEGLESTICKALDVVTVADKRNELRQSDMSS